MNIYTIGFTQKNAREFFNLIKNNKIDILLDIRLSNKSQLAGFTKGTDLPYFLKELCDCKYEHCEEFAPTKDILDRYKKAVISWDEYIKEYTKLIYKRGDYKKFKNRYSDFKNICLLCSEPIATQCHRRLLAEIIERENEEIKIIHI